MSDIAAELERLREALAAQGQEQVVEPVAPAIVDEMARRYGLPPVHKQLLRALNRWGNHGETISYPSSPGTGSRPTIAAISWSSAR